MNSTKNGRMRAHCPRCRHQQLFVKTSVNHWLNLALAVLTAGLWLVSWVALCIGKILRPWRCEHCGWHKPEFRDHDKPAAAVAAAEPPKAVQPARVTGKRAGAIREVVSWLYS